MKTVVTKELETRPVVETQGPKVGIDVAARPVEMAVSRNGMQQAEQLSNALNTFVYGTGQMVAKKVQEKADLRDSEKAVLDAIDNPGSVPLDINNQSKAYIQSYMNIFGSNAALDSKAKYQTDLAAELEKHKDNPELFGLNELKAFQDKWYAENVAAIPDAMVADKVYGTLAPLFSQTQVAVAENQRVALLEKRADGARELVLKGLTGDEDPSALMAQLIKDGYSETEAYAAVFEAGKLLWDIDEKKARRLFNGDPERGKVGFWMSKAAHSGSGRTNLDLFSSINLKAADAVSGLVSSQRDRDDKALAEHNKEQLELAKRRGLFWVDRFDRTGRKPSQAEMEELMAVEGGVDIIYTVRDQIERIAERKARETKVLPLIPGTVHKSLVDPSYQSDVEKQQTRNIQSLIASLPPPGHKDYKTAVGDLTRTAVTLHANGWNGAWDTLKSLVSSIPSNYDSQHPERHPTISLGLAIGEELDRDDDTKHLIPTLFPDDGHFFYAYQRGLVGGDSKQALDGAMRTLRPEYKNQVALSAPNGNAAAQEFVLKDRTLGPGGEFKAGSDAMNYSLGWAQQEAAKVLRDDPYLSKDQVLTRLESRFAETHEMVTSDVDWWPYNVAWKKYQFDDKEITKHPVLKNVRPDLVPKYLQDAQDLFRVKYDNPDVIVVMDHTSNNRVRVLGPGGPLETPYIDDVVAEVIEARANNFKSKEWEWYQRTEAQAKALDKMFGGNTRYGDWTDKPTGPVGKAKQANDFIRREDRETKIKVNAEAQNPNSKSGGTMPAPTTEMFKLQQDNGGHPYDVPARENPEGFRKYNWD